MNIILSVLVALTNVLGSTTHTAQVPLTQNSAECGCEKSDQGVRINFGRYKGQCVDDCKHRAAKMIRQTKTHLFVDNVLHQRRYWTAQIPIDPVEIDMAFEEFLPTVSHVFLRFRFSKPILLGAQDGSKEKTSIQDLILSSEGVPPKGERYDLIESSMGNYLLAYRLISVEEAANHMIRDLKHTVRLFRVRLDDEQKQQALRTAIQMSATQTFASVYNLITNNCATAAFEILDPKLKSPERAFPVTLSLGTLRALDEAGLWERTLVLPNLEAELGI